MGRIFNIQRFSVNDGPGIRTTVFLKGCPLNCVWCHNPESKSEKTELFYNYEKCTSCRKCAAVCKNGCHLFEGEKHIFDRKKCTVCGKCADQCLTGALETVGYDRTADEVIAEVLKDKDFYDNSGGGMTLSGGEPLLQFDFTYELLKKADAYGHKEFTGASNETIIKNLKLLDGIGAQIILRCPVIPEFNDRKEHFDGIAELANTLKNITEINIEPYHPLGSSKSEFLGKEYKLKELKFADEKAVKEWMAYIGALTKVPVKRA